MLALVRSLVYQSTQIWNCARSLTAAGRFRFAPSSATPPTIIPSDLAEILANSYGR